MNSYQNSGIYAGLQGFSVEEPRQAMADKVGNDDVLSSTEDAKNLELSHNSAHFWLVLLFLYVVWGLIQKISLTENIEKNVIKANAHNLLIVGLAAVIFKAFMNVALTKLVKWNIPFISKLAGGILPIVRG